MILSCHEVRAEKKESANYRCLCWVLDGIGIGGAVCLQCGEIGVGVGGQNIRNLKFAKPGTGDSFWKSTCSGSKWFFLGVAIMDTSVVCWLQACFSFGGDYFRYHQLTKIKMEEIMRQFEILMKPPEAINKGSKGHRADSRWTMDQSSSCHRHVGRRIRQEDSAVGGCGKRASG